MKPDFKAAIHELLAATKEVLKSNLPEAAEKQAKSHLRSSAKKVRELLDNHESNETILG